MGLTLLIVVLIVVVLVTMGSSIFSLLFLASLREVTPTEDFDFIMLAQLWPESTCAVMNAEKSGSCRTPAAQHKWTLHGLWPSYSSGGQGPQYCHHRPDWHFKAAAISSIEDDLRVRWPNVLTASSETSLWKHEWEKHGCCAGDVSDLSTELKYFSRGLDLNQIFDIQKYLSDSNITPSASATYKPADIDAAVSKGLGGISPELHCINHGLLSELESDWYMVSIRICLDKSFSVVACPKDEAGLTERSLPFLETNAFTQLRGTPPMEPCPKGKDLKYPPSSEFEYY